MFRFQKDGFMNSTIKARLSAGETLIGTFFSINAPDLVESAGSWGYDFGIMDMEHGSLSPETAAGMIRAAECRGMAPLVRVCDSRDSTILKALDIGSQGIVIPQVNNGEMAGRIVSACHYHPLGNRGLGLVRASNYGAIPVPDYFARVREQLLVIAQCETREGVEHLEEIVRTPHIDGVFLGPFDLSQSLGFPGETDHPEIRKAALRLVKLCRDTGKAAGVFAMTGEQARERADEGFRFIALGTDMTLFASAARRELASFRN